MGKDGYIDFFDVATGQASFADYLLERYDEMDLNTRLEFDPADKIEEVLRPVQPEPPMAPEPLSRPESEPCGFDFEALVAQFHAAARDYEERNR